jgi:hypothetical protein
MEEVTLRPDNRAIQLLVVRPGDSDVRVVASI